MKTLLMITLLLVAIRAPAQEALANATFDEYYTVKETSKKAYSQINPLQVAQQFFSDSETYAEIRNAVLSLMSFAHHSGRFGNVKEPYNRAKHFGAWIRDPREGSCLNTRAKVLIRDSAVKVAFSDSGCTVTEGLWSDPYSGRDFRNASDLQIDHFVALKNAYVSGAHKWNWKKRCLYANYMGNDFHLLPVYGKENSQKGDKTPEGYMPTNSDYQCQYLAHWLKTKLIWSLALTPPEKEAVQKLVTANHCSASELSYSQAELARQRKFIADNMDLCE